MTDWEYASCIYCLILDLEHTDGDMYFRGVIEAISTLEEREQRAIEYRYRYNMTYLQVGEKIGVGSTAARNVVLKARRKLRHPLRSSKMRISKLNIRR